MSLSTLLLGSVRVYAFPCDTGHTAAAQSVPAIPLSVPSRLEEDSVPNYMPCHMQPAFHQQQLPHQPLVGRSWMPSSEDDLVARKGKAQPLVAAVNGKKTPDVELSAGSAQEAAGASHTDKVDIDTQTG